MIKSLTYVHIGHKFEPCHHYWHLLIYIISFDHTCLFQSFLISRIRFSNSFNGKGGWIFPHSNGKIIIQLPSCRGISFLYCFKKL